MFTCARGFYNTDKKLTHNCISCVRIGTSIGTPGVLFTWHGTLPNLLVRNPNVGTIRRNATKNIFIIKRYDKHPPCSSSNRISGLWPKFCQTIYKVYKKSPWRHFLNLDEICIRFKKLSFFIGFVILQINFQWTIKKLFKIWYSVLREDLIFRFWFNINFILENVTSQIQLISGYVEYQKHWA